MESLWSFFFRYHDKELPASWKTTSLVVGLPVGALNVYYKRFSDEDERNEVLQYTRPFCEVVVVAGLLMTMMAFVRVPGARGRIEPWVGVLGHVVVGWSAAGAPVTMAGLWCCSAVLAAALVVYKLLEMSGVRVWPYPLAPVEVAVLCVSLLVLRMV
tara:strand:+ start:1511 stop:1981 length:471 start_codon:yes stop_codon:yes gene_type:complete